MGFQINFDELDFRIGIALALLSVFVLLWIIIRQKHIRDRKKWLAGAAMEEKEQSLNRLIDGTGFLYDGEQDIFCSEKNPWQKRFGYSRAYDEASAVAGMVIDCEPIYFDYDTRGWMLELWKGQYGMSVGGEIGLYQAAGGNGAFYQGVEPEDYIDMEMELLVKETHLFWRQAKHWWLTGFAVGRAALPQEVKLRVKLTFHSRLMCLRFAEGLQRAGYSRREYHINGDSIRLLFDRPHTKQPAARGRVRDRLRVTWFSFLCRLYRFYTREYENTADKLLYLQVRAPLLFAAAAGIGRGLKLFRRGE